MNRKYQHLLYLIDENDGVLNDSIVQFITINNLLGAMFLQDNPLKNDALNIACDGGYELSEQDVNCILLAYPNGITPETLGKVHLPDSVLFELYFDNPEFFDVLNAQGFFARLAKEKFAELFRMGYKFAYDCKLVKALQSRGDDFVITVLDDSPQFFDTFVDAGLDVDTKLWLKILSITDALDGKAFELGVFEEMSIADRERVLKDNPERQIYFRV